MLAGAPGHGFGFFDFGFEGAEVCAFVRAVAEGLAFGASAGAPPICAGLNFLDDGRFLENDPFVHIYSWRFLKMPVVSATLSMARSMPSPGARWRALVNWSAQALMVSVP